MEILKLKSTIAEMEHSLEEFNCRSGLEEERISELNDRLLEIIQSEKLKKILKKDVEK